MTLNIDKGSLLNVKLSELKSFNPADFMKSGELKKLDNAVLMFALAWNDLKNVLWVFDISDERLKVSKSLIKENKPCKVKAEIQSQKMFAIRQGIAILQEIRIKLAKLKRDGVFENKAWKQTENTLKQWQGATKCYEAWERLKKLLRDEDGGEKDYKPIREAIFNLRNRVSSHYDLKELEGGYGMFFMNKTVSQYNARAFLCLGNSGQETHFCFADATVQEILRNAIPSLENPDLTALREQIENLNFALFGFIRCYFVVRKIALKSEE